MARIVFSGVLERHPDLKLLIHHGGSMVPHFSGRVGPGWQLGTRTPPELAEDVQGYPLAKRPIDYFLMMYADTAMFGAAHALRCSIDLYGADRVLGERHPPVGAVAVVLIGRRRGARVPGAGPSPNGDRPPNLAPFGGTGAGCGRDDGL